MEESSGEALNGRAEEPDAAGQSRARFPILVGILTVVAAAVALIAGVLAIIVLVPGEGSEGQQIHGSLALSDIDTSEFTDLSVTNLGDTCYGTGGYDDISEGAQVVLRDGEGKVIGTSSLNEGHSNLGCEVGDVIAICTFEFIIEDVPSSDFYSVEVSHRGEINFSHEELERQGWEVSLTLGGFD
jgi:hypothetical protein